jgi:multiple sugar transport system ATP-binding protein
MNLLDGIVQARNGDLSFRIGDHELPLSKGALYHYPRTREADGQHVVVGIRPGNLHPAASRPDLPVIEAQLDLVEALGSESMAYFRIDAEVVRPAGADEAEEEIEEGGEGVTATRPNLVAAFPPDLKLTLGDRIPVAVEVDKLHFFERETGAPLR